MSKMSGLHRKEQARLFCQGHAGKVRFYKKVLADWLEPGDGTFIVKINKGFSFDKDTEIREMKFNTVDDAINSMEKVYAGVFCKVENDKITIEKPKAESERLSDKKKLEKLIKEFG